MVVSAPVPPLPLPLLNKHSLQGGRHPWQHHSQMLSRKEEIQITCIELLNELTPANEEAIVDRLSDIQLYTTEELECVADIVFSKALLEPQSVEMYSGIVASLKGLLPLFPPECEGMKPVSFTSLFLSAVQNEFENLSCTLQPTREERRQLAPKELLHEMSQRKQRLLALVRFMGHLVLRKLLAIKVVAQVVHDLIGIKDTLPAEPMIECTCALLEVIGPTMDSTRYAKELMVKFCGRLQDLKRLAGPDGCATYSERTQYLIGDFLELRKQGWKMKTLLGGRRGPTPEAFDKKVLA